MMGLEPRGEPLWGRSGVTGRGSVEPDRAITANGKELTTKGRSCRFPDFTGISEHLPPIL